MLLWRLEEEHSSSRKSKGKGPEARQQPGQEQPGASVQRQMRGQVQGLEWLFEGGVLC